MDLLRVNNLTKDFGGIRALDEVSFSVSEGEIHCLCGENGAGKSTLVKIISGVIPYGDFKGEVYFKDELQTLQNVKDSETKGISIIHQELALSPYLSIAENIFLGHFEKRKFGAINFYDLVNKSSQLLQKIGLNENPQTIVSSMGLGKQQLVEIAKALSKNTKLLILDEPTSSLNDQESDHLLNLILELKKEGITSIMISHKLNEVLKIADTITILRDGKTISSFGTKEEKITENRIVKDMVGRELTNRFPVRETSTVTDEVLLEVKNWNVFHPNFPDKKVIQDIDLHVKKGEIVGLCGLMGSGRTELMMSIFGSSYGSHSTGEVYLHGEKKIWHTPKEAIKDGVGYVSEDRKDLGLILIQDVKKNISNSNLNDCSRFGIINSHAVEKISLEYKDKMKIKTPTVHVVVSELSGGNQQKVVLSRCLFAKPEVLIVDEPTRGIDVGAKYEIYLILNELVKSGKGIIVISSELEEILGITDRLYIMNQGRLKGELITSDATQEKIMHIAIGDSRSYDETK